MYLIRIKDSVVAGGEGPRGRWRHSQRLPVIKFATTPSRLTTVSSSLLHLLHLLYICYSIVHSVPVQHCSVVWCTGVVQVHCVLALPLCSSTLQCGVHFGVHSGGLQSCTVQVHTVPIHNSALHQ